MVGSQSACGLRCRKSSTCKRDSESASMFFLPWMYDKIMFRLTLVALKKMARIMAIMRESVHVPDCHTSMVVLLSEKSQLPG